MKLLILTLMSLSAFAGKGGGNGADAIVCYDKPVIEEVWTETSEAESGVEVDHKNKQKTYSSQSQKTSKTLRKIVYAKGKEPKIVSAELLDFYEKRVKKNKYKINLNPKLSVEKNVITVLRNLEKFDTSRSERLLKRYLERESGKIPLFRIVERGEIPDAKDSDYNLKKSLGENCYEVPLAYQQSRSEIYPGDPKVLIAGDIYNSSKFSYEDKVGTIIHELLLEEEVEKERPTSDGIRFFNYLVCSDYMDDVSKEDYLVMAAFYNLAYPENIYNVYGVNVHYQVYSYGTKTWHYNLALDTVLNIEGIGRVKLQRGQAIYRNAGSKDEAWKIRDVLKGGESSVWYGVIEGIEYQVERWHEIKNYNYSEDLEKNSSVIIHSNPKGASFKTKIYLTNMNIEIEAKTLSLSSSDENVKLICEKSCKVKTSDGSFSYNVEGDNSSVYIYIEADTGRIQKIAKESPYRTLDSEFFSLNKGKDFQVYNTGESEYYFSDKNELIQLKLEERSDHRIPGFSFATKQEGVIQYELKEERQYKDRQMKLHFMNNTLQLVKSDEFKITILKDQEELAHYPAGTNISCLDMESRVCPYRLGIYKEVYPEMTREYINDILFNMFVMSRYDNGQMKYGILEPIDNQELGSERLKCKKDKFRLKDLERRVEMWFDEQGQCTDVRF